MQKPSLWSIGIYRGASPLALEPGPRNPVLTVGDITDVSARLIADPFMISTGGTWFMFFEVVDHEAGRGKIAHATSADGASWHYQGIVLEEPFHLSYPHVFEWEGAFFMTPETAGAGTVRLYRADRFPRGWRLVSELLHLPLADPTPFRSGDGWWMFGCRPKVNDRLTLYHADHLRGPWVAHLANPLTDGCRRSSRPAGRIIDWEGRPLRLAQDCEPHYGVRVRGFSITELSTEVYREQEIQPPLLEPGASPWNRDGMHHLDLHRGQDGDWLAAVDGFRFLPT